MVRCRDDGMFLHLLHQFRGLVVADAEFALDIRGGAFAVFRHDGDGLIIEGAIPKTAENAKITRCEVEKLFA